MTKRSLKSREYLDITIEKEGKLNGKTGLNIH